MWWKDREWVSNPYLGSDDIISFLTSKWQIFKIKWHIEGIELDEWSYKDRVTECTKIPED